MEGASAATASGCDYDESLTQKESLTTVASGCDAFSPPSTSNPNPGPESPFVPSLEDECYSSGFNEDFMQGIEKPTSPFVGGKAPVRLNVSDDDESQSDDESQPDDESQTDDESQPDDESQTDDESQFESQMMAGWDGLSAHSTSKTDSSLNMSYASSSDDDSYSSRYRDDFMQEIKKSMSPFVSDKEPLSALAAEFESGSPIIQEKIKLLGEKYTALRRTRGDGNCFYRSFMFSYLEHILVTENRAELDRVLVNIEQCRVDLFNLGYAEFTYEDFFGSFTELLEGCLPGTKASLSLTELLEKACDQITSNCAVMFLRFVTSAAIQKRAEFFEPFVSGLSHKSVAQFCKTSVEPMGEESEEVHIIALSDALGVPIRVVYLDSHISGDPENPTAAANHHDFFPSANNNLENNGSNCTDAANVSTDLSKQENPAPLVTLLYRPGHYDILYPL